MKWAKLIKSCKGLGDKKKLTSVRVDIIFSKFVAKGRKEMGLQEFVGGMYVWLG